MCPEHKVLKWFDKHFHSFQRDRLLAEAKTLAGQATKAHEVAEAARTAVTEYSKAGEQAAEKAAHDFHKARGD